MTLFKKVFYNLLAILLLFMTAVSAYSPTTKDNTIISMFVDKIEQLKIQKPSVVDKFIVSLPTFQKQFEQQGKERLSYIIGEIYNKLTSNISFSSETKINTTNNLGRDKTQFQYVYEVGPNKQYSDLSQVPRESLKPSTLVLIYYKDTPYYNKFVINANGSQENPIVILGVPNNNGELPKINGAGATTRLELDYWNEERSLIKVGGSSKPSESIKPSRVYIENLDIYGAKHGNSFYNDNGESKDYAKNATCIHIEYGDNIFLKNNKIHDCSNGIFTTHFTDHIFIQGNEIYNNGNAWDMYTHNTYTESKNIVYEYNFMGDLFPGAIGNNLKDRSAGTIIRYNWIQGGNRQIDLVETSYDELKNLPQYNQTFVYGNILIEKRDEGNQQILHYGGDGGDKSKYRNGQLYFYNNTIISYRDGYTTLINLSLNTAQMYVYNNIIYTTAGPRNFALSDGRGQFFLENNILPPQWKQTHNANFDGKIYAQNNIETDNPGFIDFYTSNFGLNSNSIALGRARTLGYDFLPITKQYKDKAKFEPRKTTNNIGALE